ncbi:putative hydantoin utilization protein C [Coniochaeta sp. PMI_546]|nr:putative hydantoin utilization protein C [Coniochaeta sp. PMI_546]
MTVQGLVRGLATANDAPGKTSLQQTFQSLSVNGSRLMNSIHSTCEYGKTHPYGDHHTETGMARLSLNDDDKKVRHWLIDQAKALGCTVTVDQMGNIFAVRHGKSEKAPVMMGSHLDTQPTGGRYDGILGVMAGLEVLRTLHENDYQTEGPVGIVNWTNEEGARFPIVTVSSGVWAGSIPLETAWNTTEVPTLMTDPSSSPRTLKQELQRIGYLGATPASHEANPIGAHFELHIEQGPILEDEQQKIGVVTGAQGYNWYEVVVKGRDSHAGTTPLRARRDALLGAAKMVAASNTIARDLDGLITTGIFRAEPGSVNTMAHTVRFTLDIRHPSNDKLAEMVARCRETFDRIAKEDCERGVQVQWTTLTENVAVEFHRDCIAAVEESAEEVCGRLAGASEDKKLWRRMTSGAGHDSCHVSKRAPTAMIFTPTRNGMSHTPDEYCSPEDCILGAQVLLGAVVRYDGTRT